MVKFHGNRTHGRSKSPEYVSWLKMKRRCLIADDPIFRYYGGRGISIDPRWLDFPTFLADMGDKPGPDYTLERIDNQRGYSPDNVKWADKKTQARNTRRNHLITIGGITKPMAVWAEDVGIKSPTIRARLKSGWSDEAAVFTPLHS